MKFKKAAVIASSLLLMLNLLTPVFAFSYESSYTIDVPYDFPVRPGDQNGSILTIMMIWLRRARYRKKFYMI